MFRVRTVAFHVPTARIAVLVIFAGAIWIGSYNVVAMVINVTAEHVFFFLVVFKRARIFLGASVIVRVGV